MQFKTGQTVVRQDPGQHAVTFNIESDKDIKYHTDLQEKGYKYTDITKKLEIDFDLPEVVSNNPSKPRVHAGSDSVCTACES